MVKLQVLLRNVLEACVGPVPAEAIIDVICTGEPGMTVRYQGNDYRFSVPTAMSQQLEAVFQTGEPQFEDGKPIVIAKVAI